MTKLGVISGMQGYFLFESQKYVIHHSHSLKKEKRRVITIDAEEAFDKIQRPFTTKTEQTGIKRNFLSLIRVSTKIL